MTQVSSAALAIVTHGVASIEFRVTEFGDRSKPLPAIRLFPQHFWRHVLTCKLEDCSVTYKLVEAGILRVFVSLGDGYLSDDRQTCDDVALAYFGDVRISDASVSIQLAATAETILALMKEWAKEQLDPGKVAA